MVRHRLVAAVAALTVAATLAACTPPLAVTTTTVPDATVNTPYSATLAASGGTTPYSWTVSAGALPAGLSLSTSGVLSGTPRTVGSSSFTVQVRDASDATASKALSMQVLAATTTADWPQHDADAGGQGWSPNERSLAPANVGALAEEWSVRTSCCSDPAVLQGILYSAGTLPDDPAADGIRAHALADGSLLWTAPLDSTCGPSSVLVDAGAVYVLCGSSVRAYARTGSHALLWDTAETDPGQSFTYGSLAGTTLLVWSINGGPTLAYRTSDGQRLWQALPATGSSVRDVAVGGTTVVIAEDARLRAVSLSTGAALWSRTDVTTSNLVVSAGWVYTNDDGGAKRYALSNGAPGWAVRSGGNIYEVVAADANNVYVWEAVFDFGPPSPSRIHALRLSDGVTRWSADVPSRISDVAVTGDLVWVTSTDIYSQGRASDLLALRRSDGVQVDRTTWDDNMYAGAAFASGKVVVTQGGSFGASTPQRIRVLGLAPPVPAITAVVGALGRVGTAYRFDLTAAGGRAPYSWSITGGALPAGLTLSGAGVVSGTPTANGTSRVTVSLRDAAGRTASRTIAFEVVPAGGSSDWPAPGRDGAGQGSNPAETTVDLDVAAQLAYRWRTVQVPATTTSDLARQPVVVGSRLYDVLGDGKLRAFATAGTGTNRAALWTTNASPTDASIPFLGQVVASGATLYAIDQSGALVAVRASDGVRLWRREAAVASAGSTSEAPLIVGGLAIVVDSYLNDVRAYAAATGEPAWGGAVVDLPAGYGTPTAVTDGTRAFVLANCQLHAVTVATGALAWSQDPDPQGCSSYSGYTDRPIVAEGMVLAPTGASSTASALDAATGAVRWRRAAADAGLGQGVVTHGAWLFSRNGGVGDSTLTALDVRTGAVLWENEGDDQSTSYTSAGDLVVARSLYSIRGFNALTGEVVWEGGSLDGGSAGPPTIAAGRVYLSTAGGGVRAYGLP